MPNRTVHLAVGGVIGAAAAGVRAHIGATEYVLPEALGGAVGGMIGAWLPDALDPPNHPHHRGIGHGCAALMGVGFFMVNSSATVDRLRSMAEKLRAQAGALRPDDQLRAVLLDAVGLLALVLAGSITGMGVGYASHLVMDGTTPKGLPLIGLADA